MAEGQIELRPVGGAPLRDGFVAPFGRADARVYARRRCVLRGALPGERYDVALLVHLFDPTCSNAPAVAARGALTTDAAGDGLVELAVRREDVPDAVRGASHGVRWEVRRDGEPAYRSDCAAVTLD